MENEHMNTRMSKKEEEKNVIIYCENPREKKKWEKKKIDR